MGKRFSLILSTYGRYDELLRYVESLIDQDFSLDNIELIIVDQNDRIDLTPIIDRFKSQIEIIHVKPDFRGLSICRNEGMKYARGEIIAFPDDDCTYYPNTLSVANQLMEDHPEIDVFIGRVYDRVNQRNIIRNWKKHPYSVNMLNFITSYASITLFTRLKDVRFDENMGVGTKFGSYEDADYVVQVLKTERKVNYHPDIQVWHPELNVNSMNPDKILSYGMGFGALCKKHRSFRFIIILMFVIFYHSLLMIGNALIFNFKGIKKRRLSIISRLKGYKNYEN